MCREIQLSNLGCALHDYYEEIEHDEQFVQLDDLLLQFEDD